MLKNTLKSTVSSFVIYLSILLPVNAMSDDDSVELDNSTLSSSSHVNEEPFDEYKKRITEKYKHAKALELGRGIERNIDEAKKIYTELIDEANDAKSSLRLGMLYEKDKNFTEALKNYKHAWKNSDGSTYLKAAMKCAEFYEKGLATIQYLPEAIRIYDQIASHSKEDIYTAEAIYRVGFIMQFNPKFGKKFKRNYKDAAELGNKEAQFLMGCARKSRPNKTKAINWFKKASDQGYVPARLALIEMALKGHIAGQRQENTFNAFRSVYEDVLFKQQWTSYFRFNEPQNTEEAFQLFKTNINTRNIEVFLTNPSYCRGHREYISLLQLASAKGHPWAAFTLGQMCEKGRHSIAPNPEKAFRFYLQAAQRRHPRAMFSLAEAYKHGRGTPKSFSEAFTWLRRAALAGHPEAIKKHKELFYFLLPESLRTDYEGDSFNPHDHDFSVIASLYSHPGFGPAMMTHWNKLLNSPNQEEMGDISRFIIENRRALEISEDSDFFIEVLGKKAISENVVDPKSPFKVWPALLQKRAVPVDLRGLTQELPLWESEGRRWRFNPTRLDDFGNEIQINPNTVPEIAQNDLRDALDKIQTKLTENQETIQSEMDEITKVHNKDIPIPFEDLRTFALGYNGRSFLMNSLSKKSIEGAQLKCVLNYIRSFSDEGEGLSSREEKLITFLMSIKACEIGQESGLTSYYQVYVPTPFKYSVTGDLFSHDRSEIQASKYVFVSLMKEVVDSILNTDNRFMRDICKERNVPQLSHQALYLKTLIGDKIGVPLCRFDPSTGLLTDGLLALSKEGGLRHFYEYILTNENLWKEVESKINQAVLTGNTYLKLRELTAQWTYKDDEDGTPQITRNGVLELLVKVELFEEVLQEASTGSACSSSSSSTLGGSADDGAGSDDYATPNIKRQRTKTGHQRGAI
ncbi:tetratricopeptide repeat protein [Kamptonema cortianum]|nr:tetratricopeptide repeat protein [Geitlerinema splendidum]MDK3160693.1 tetratricopeptide repeat protein [Kamptonema cortianum]